MLTDYLKVWVAYTITVLTDVLCLLCVDHGSAPHSLLWGDQQGSPYLAIFYFMCQRIKQSLNIWNKTLSWIYCLLKWEKAMQIRHTFFKQSRELISFRAFGKDGIWGLADLDESVLTSAVEAWILWWDCCSLVDMQRLLLLQVHSLLKDFRE